MLRISLAVLLLGCAPSAAQSDACAGAKEADVTNGGFEDETGLQWDSRKFTKDSSDIAGWECKYLKGNCDECGTGTNPNSNYDTCIIAKQSSAFGNYQSGEGNNFLIMHGRVAIAQTINDLKAGNPYVLRFKISERAGYGDNEIFNVLINGEIVEKHKNAPSAFTQYTYIFTAPSDGSVEIEFQNRSPNKGGDIREGHTLLIDQITVVETVDCGTGAACHMAFDNNGYMCKCNGRGYVGHDARNKKAECVDVTTLGGGGSDEAMVEKVEVLQEEMVAVEGGVKGLQEDKQGIESSIESATADILALQEFQTSTEEGTTLANDALKTAQGDIVTLNGKLDDSNQQLTELKDLVNTLVATNTKLVSALKGAQATVPDAPKEPSPDRSFAPEVNGDAGGIDFKLQKGRHATVNDEMLLTATEVAELIKGAVQDTLNAVGGALE